MVLLIVKPSKRFIIASIFIQLVIIHCLCLPTQSPSQSPTDAPSQTPSNPPTGVPSNAPSHSPTAAPSQTPSDAPSQTPSNPPTGIPSYAPSHSPSQPPSNAPTGNPSYAPTGIPSYAPSNLPSQPPSNAPTGIPSYAPSHSPTETPSNSPTQPPSRAPSRLNTSAPTQTPSTLSPTSEPSVAPSQTPTRAPTVAPSAPPTRSPTDAPSQTPSEPPTFSPTGVPTPIIIIHTTESDADAAQLLQYERDLNNLEATYETVFITVASLFAIVALAAWSDAKYIRANDYLKINQILGMALQTMDMLSDCFFAVNVRIQSQLDSKYFVPMILAICFIVIPALMTILQLHFQCKHWLRSSDQVRGWLSKKLKPLYFLSISTGSSFAAITLVNSYVFQLRLFDMGLTDKELSAFMYKRVYSVVLIENIPQLCLQIWFITSLGTVDDPITMTSIILSVISIFISVFSMMTERNIAQTQAYVAISMKVTGHAVTSGSNARNCKTLKDALTEQLALFVGVHSSVVEVIKPIQIKHGFELNVNFYFGDATKAMVDYHKILMDANKTDALQELLEQSWKLSAKPVIGDIKQTVIQSNATDTGMQLAEYQMETMDANAKRDSGVDSK